MTITLKDISFEVSLTLPIFGSGKAIRILQEEYKAEKIKRSWSLRHPFSLFITANIQISHEVDLEKMRQVQHGLLVKRGRYGNIHNT